MPVVSSRASSGQKSLGGRWVLFIDGYQLKAKSASLKNNIIRGGLVLMKVAPTWQAGGGRVLRG